MVYTRDWMRLGDAPGNSRVIFGGSAVATLAREITAAGGTLVVVHQPLLQQIASTGTLSAWGDANGGAYTVSAAGAARPSVDSGGLVTFTTSQYLQYAGNLAEITNGALFGYAGILPTTGVRSLMGLGSNVSSTLLQAYRADGTNMAVGGGAGVTAITLAAVAGQTTFYGRRYVRASDTVVGARIAQGVEAVGVTAAVGPTFTPNRHTLNAQFDLSAGGDCASVRGFVLVGGNTDSKNAPNLIAAIARYLNRACGASLTTTPQVVAFGNSFPAGFGVAAGSDFVSNLMGRARFSGWSSTNRAISGQTTTQMASNIETDGYVRSQPERSRNIAIVCEIINEIQTNGGNAANAYTAIRDYCVNLRAAGFEVYCLTPTNRTDASAVAGFDTARLSVRTSMLANFPPLGLHVVDLNSDSRIGGSSAPNDTTYFQADKIHPNATGHGLIADLVNAAIT